MLEVYEEKQSKASLNIKEVDPNLNLDANQKINEIDTRLNLRENIDFADKKKRFSKEIIKEILNSQDITEEEKEKYREIQKKIHLHYYYCYQEIHGNLFHMIKHFEEDEFIMDKNILLSLPETLDYDVEFYKIGKNCKGLRKRYGIIKRHGFFSSKKPLGKADKNKMKDKSQFLPGSEVLLERMNEENGKQNGEWSNKEKHFRIRINYIRDRKKNNPKYDSSFFFYFDDEKKMMTVYYMLFGQCLDENTRTKVKESFNALEISLKTDNTFYTILKILAVKQKIKNRKNIIKKVNDVIHGEMFNKLSSEVVESLIKYASERNKKKNKLKSKPPLIPNAPYKDVFSDYIPLISNVSPISNKEDLNYKQRSINKLIKKFKELEEEIPQDIVEQNTELSDDGVCLSIPNGVIIDKKEDDEDGEDDNFKLNSNNSKYIFFDKNKPEIIFKNENNDNAEENEEILSDTNIYEISNVILNSNSYVNGVEENNLIIVGPKINNDRGIVYRYKDDNTSYIDPEIVNIKRKTFNKNNKNKNEIKGTTLQIFHSELDINHLAIKKFKENLTGTVNKEIDFEINNENFKDYFLFGYKLILSEFKSMDGKYVYPKIYKDNICFVEYNHQYFIPEEYFNENSKLIIELFCLPVHAFSQKDKKDIEKIQKEYLGKLLSPINYGYIEVEYKDLINKKYKYPVKDTGIDESNSFIIISGDKDQMDSTELKLMEGKDYSIGDEAYIETLINKQFIDDAKENPCIPEEIRQKYFNVNFDQGDFLFRPNEEMSEEEFRKDISSQLSDEQIQKICENKQYNYLPCCMKYKSKNGEEIDNITYLNKSNIYDDPNFKCLTKEEKDFIVNNNEGKEEKWIYKASDIKVKLLSKNIGVKSTQEINQLVYSNGERKPFPIKSLNKERENLIIPISENGFNVFDMKEMDVIKNLDNFKWKTGIKFNNSLQMKTFLKLLTLARQKINTKMKNNNEYCDEIDIKKLIKFEKNRDNQCEINVEFVDFRQDFQINLPTHFYFSISSEGKVINNLYSYFENSEYGFQNELFNNEDIRNNLNLSNRNASGNEVEFQFRKKVKINHENFKYKKLNMNDKMKGTFLFNREDITQNYYLNIKINNNGGYRCIFDLNKINNPQRCNKLELPIYKKGEENGKMYGCAGIDLYLLNDSGQNFQKRFEELNKTYLILPLQVLKAQTNEKNIQLENYHFGLYEPNIFRRKILNFIHDKKYDLKNLDENESNNLYNELLKKCVDLSLYESFSSFNFNNIKINFDKNIDTNSYRKKLGLKLLTIKRHEEFMKDFRESEWDIYMNFLRNFNDISRDSLLRDRNDIHTFHSLIYLGIAPKYRENIYRKILKINILVEKTKDELRRIGKNFFNEKEIFTYFADQLYDNQNKTNLIFSLIDNDCTFLYSLANITLEDIEAIKKIAKSFYYWAELKINLNNKIDKYVYFIGLLSIIEKLRKYFKEDYLVFWLLIGLSQYIDHFTQKNPLFSDEMNYINVYGLVTKLILEQYFKNIYDKFISLNFPIEFFISRHLSALFTDYFNDELIMRIFDIIIFESSFKGKFSDNLHYLRILCSIPVTLFELSQKRIIACESVSEIESIFNNLISHTFNNNKFIFTLEKNVNTFFISQGFLVNLFYQRKIQEWDNKRGDIADLNYKLFRSVYEENNNYLKKINDSQMNNSQEIYKNYLIKLDNKLSIIKSIYFKQDDSFNDEQDWDTGIMLQVSKLQQFYNNDTINIQRYKLIIFFDDENIKDEFGLQFDTQNNKIINTNDLYIKKKFKKYNFPKNIHLELKDEYNNLLGSFIYLIVNHEFMKLSKIVLENRESKNKFFIEFLFFKYTNKELEEQDSNLYNNIFRPPEYLHSTSIEERLYSCTISNNSFKSKINQYIKKRNSDINEIQYYKQFEETQIKNYKNYNNYEEDEDKYNIRNKQNSDNKILSQINNILNSISEQDILDNVKEWTQKTNTSIEEILYSLVLIDKSFFTINEKLLNLFLIAQAKDKILFKSDKLSIEKLKEMIYSLYKRFMIYFTKSEVERMIDFLLKDERLFNIKYAFVYKEDNANIINEFIYDKDRYEPRLDIKNDFEIYYDNIDKQLNIILNHLNNRYNMKILSKEMLTFILENVITKKDLAKYQSNGFNKITLVIETDNLMYKRNFKIEYSPLKIIEEQDSLFDVKPKNEGEIIDRILCNEISAFDTNNSYSIDNFISFMKFKEIFFKMPYLSDLFRVSFSYINEEKDFIPQYFENLKVTISYEKNIENQEENMNITDNNINNNNNNDVFGVFYFPNIIDEDNMGSKIYGINNQINSSYNVDTIINLIINYFKSKNSKKENEIWILNYIKNTDKINCYLYYYKNEDEIENGAENKIKKEIGYFDRLYSYVELNNKKYIEIEIKYKTDLFTYNASHNLVERGKGYCKIFYSNNNEFFWKKCYVKQNKENATLISADYKTQPILNNNEIILAYDL